MKNTPRFVRRKTYSFCGTAVSGKLGARVVGQVRTTDTSYHWIVKEVIELYSAFPMIGRPIVPTPA